LGPLRGASLGARRGSAQVKSATPSLKQAETYLKKREKIEQLPRRHQQTSFWANLCGVPPQ